MIGIYKIENKITHKVYIGQSIDIKNRWISHKVPSSWNDPSYDNYYRDLYADIRKYGLDNFDFSILEECKKEDLDKKEIYWISFYNSYNNGYNLTSGGQKGPRESKQKVYAYDRYGNFIQEYDNVRSAAEALNTTTSAIYCAICDKHLGAGYQWSYEKVNNMPFYINNELPVIAYDLQGNKVADYNNIQQAATLTNDGITAISTMCETRQYTNNTKYQWRYAIDHYQVDKITSSIENNPFAISQYDLQGNLIAHYNSMTEALKKLNLTGTVSVSNLSTCLNKGQKSFNGYLWTHYGEPAPKPYVDARIGHTTSSNKKIILQYSKSNEFIQEYESAHEAARSINKPTCANHITECCQGKRKTCQGYIWKYKEK